MKKIILILLTVALVLGTAALTSCNELNDILGSLGTNGDQTADTGGTASVSGATANTLPENTAPTGGSADSTLTATEDPVPVPSTALEFGERSNAATVTVRVIAIGESFDLTLHTNEDTLVDAMLKLDLISSSSKNANYDVILGIKANSDNFEAWNLYINGEVYKQSLDKLVFNDADSYELRLVCLKSGNTNG
jgi:hypothetical protein